MKKKSGSLTLVGHFDRLKELYGARNAMYHPRELRRAFVDNAMREFSKQVGRKRQKDKLILGRAIASVFSRTYAWADSFGIGSRDIVAALCEKYPAGHCAYCGGAPCACELNRRTQIVHAQGNGRQMKWRLAQWCRNSDLVYGSANRSRGIEAVIARIFEEIGEVSDAQLFDTYDRRLTLTDLKRLMAREFADVFAWLCAAVVVLEIDIETILTERYRVCPRCDCPVCDCGPVFFRKEVPPLDLGKAESTVVA